MHGVRKIGLFGSYVRQEENADSDIDILVDFKEGEDKYDNLIYVYDLLESKFVDTKIEVVTVNGLSPYIGPHILKEVEYA
jgi:predicted nucleotidyltransferase